MREALDVPQRLEGLRMRARLEKMQDPEFDALIDFVRGAEHDQMITGKRFQKAYEALTSRDDVIVWLCMVAMAVLNPGDVRSRLIYRHLEALVQAVANGEMTQRTAFRFYESAIRSPAYREIAQRQLSNGCSTRLAGICAATEVMRKLGVCSRPMSSYFELFQRITERSEAMTPWGFPPLFQFEERLALEPRLKFFSRTSQAQLNQRRKKALFGRFTRMYGPRILWVPPIWKQCRRWMGNHYVGFPGIVPD